VGTGGAGNRGSREAGRAPAPPTKLLEEQAIPPAAPNCSATYSKN